MLENLDRIRWRKARHAYGSAADVPALLRGLASPDENVRYEALSRLHGNIHHQGNRYEASALAVPFLFELVLDPATPDREDLVFFLVSLAFGYESAFLPFCATPAEEPQRWEPEERATYDAVAERIASLAPLLREAEPLRFAVAYALALFPRSAAATAGDVRRAYDASTGETTRAMLLLALAMLSLHVPDKEEAVSLLRHVHGGDGSAFLRSTAAAGLALLGAADDDVVETIREAIIDGSAGTTKFLWNDGDFDGYLAMVLPLAAGGREAAIAARLIDALPGANVDAKRTITYALLGVTAPPTDYRALSGLQRRVLQAIDEHGQWDRNGERIVNFAVMASGNGLPGDHDDFHSFVEAAESSARGEAVEWKLQERPARHPAKPRESPFFTILFGTMILLWLVLVAIDPTLLSRTPGGWGLLSLAVLVLGLSVFSLWRPRRSKP